MDTTQIAAYQMPFGMASIGIDVGHSAVKIAASMLHAPHLAQRWTDTIKSVVMPAVELTETDSARDALRDTVTVNGQKYYVGDTALTQSQPVNFSGEARDWIATTTHDALITAAYQRALAGIGVEPRVIHLALGLPTAFFASQKESLKARVTALLLPLMMPGQRLEIIVAAQSTLPIKNRQHCDDGTPDPMYSPATHSYAVIDVGHFTSDFSVLLGRQYLEIGGDSVAGANGVYSALRAKFNALDYGTGLGVVNSAMTTGFVRQYGELVDVRDLRDAAIQPLRDAIVNRAQSIIGPHVRELNQVIVTGGIAPLVVDAVKAIFPRNTVLDDAPLMNVAEGLCRFGLFAHRAWASRYAQ